ncbi:minor capsid protein [Candidatus Saccharibacteria bacterium]|nr:minor capsid protein [Candidatus Saccharibacteria bacterium]
MAKRSNAYWEKRSIERLTRAEKTSVPYLKQIQKIYRSSARSVVRTVKETYASYYRNDKTFNRDALEEIEPRGNITKFLNDMAQSGLKTTLPENFKGRMSRLRMLEAQLWGESKKIALQEQELSTSAYKKIISETYNRTIFDIAKGTGKTPSFTTLNQGTINAILNTKFEGSNYSERVWANTDKLADSLKDILVRAVATGQGQEKTVREVMERFSVGFNNANRLVRTETNYFENKAELESYEELGIKKFRFVATLDERTSDICRAMDGKEFSVKEADQGENAPPLHPYCRSTIVPVVEGWEPQERGARDAEGGIYMTGKKTYGEWTKEVREKSAKKTDPLNYEALDLNKANNAEPKYTALSDEEITRLDETAERIINLAPREEEYALENYTGLTFKYVNDYLYGKYEGNPNIIHDVSALDSLLNRFKTPRNMRTFRGVKYKDYEKYIQMGVGTKFKLNGFASTSVKKHIAQEFYDHIVETGERALMLELKVPKDTPSFFIGPRSMHSNAYNEVELLLKRGLQYEVESIKDGIMVLKVIADG